MKKMTEGSAATRIVVFAVPLLFSNILQQFYSVAGTLIAGNLAGKNALAAVGTATPIMNILTFLIVGIAMGSSILIAEFFGAAQYLKLKQQMITVVLSGLAFTVFLSSIMYFCVEPMLMLIETPLEILPPATAYLRIITIGLIFSFLYNTLASSLNAIGDSVAPLFFLMIAAGVNVVLGIWLVRDFSLGVCGVAYATVISQAVSALLCVLYIYWRVPILCFGIGDLKIHWPLLTQTFRYSSVSAVQQTFLYVGIFILQGAVNPLGLEAIAAYNVAARIDGFILAPTDSLALALTTFVSQNRGAKQSERMRQGMQASLIIGGGCCLLLAVLAFVWAQTLMTLFLDHAEVEAIATGVNYLRWMAFFYILAALCNSFQGFFRGMGRMDITLYATLVQIPVRVLLAYLLVLSYGLPAVAVGIALGWICMIAYEGWQYRQYRLYEGVGANEISVQKT